MDVNKELEISIHMLDMMFERYKTEADKIGIGSPLFDALYTMAMDMAQARDEMKRTKALWDNGDL